MPTRPLRSPAAAAVTVCGGLVLAAGGGTVLSACGGGSRTPMPVSQVLSSDPASRTVTVHAVAAYGGMNGDMNFDGYSYGTLHIRVPYGWLVRVECSDGSGRLPHSCAIINNVPADLGRRPTDFPAAATADPYNGMAPGRTATFSFVTDRTGVYRLACLVHGHEIDGMWDYFEITPGGQPSAVVGRGAGR